MHWKYLGFAFKIDTWGQLDKMDGFNKRLMIMVYLVYLINVLLVDNKGAWLRIVHDVILQLDNMGTWVRRCFMLDMFFLR